MKLDKLFLSLGLLSSLSLSTYAAEYKIDEAHTAVTFKIKHMGISHTSGTFENVSGSFSFDPSEPTKASANATILTKSINTGIKQRDEHLRSAEFLDVEKYPQMTFKTQSMQSTGPNSFDIKGTLTLHGVSKPVVLKANYEGSVKDPFGNERAGFTASTKINRKDFGLNFHQTLETGDGWRRSLDKFRS